LAPILKGHYGSCTLDRLPLLPFVSFAVGRGLPRLFRRAHAARRRRSSRVSTGTKLRVQVRCFNPCVRGRSQKMITLNDIQSALRRIRSSIYLSPCARSETFSESNANTVYLKLDNLQRTGAFKERGALNKLL